MPKCHEKFHEMQISWNFQHEAPACWKNCREIWKTQKILSKSSKFQANFKKKRKQLKYFNGEIPKSSQKIDVVIKFCSASDGQLQKTTTHLKQYAFENITPSTVKECLEIWCFLERYFQHAGASMKFHEISVSWNFMKRFMSFIKKRSKTWQKRQSKPSSRNKAKQLHSKSENKRKNKRKRRQKSKCIKRAGVFRPFFFFVFFFCLCGCCKNYFSIIFLSSSDGVLPESGLNSSGQLALTLAPLCHCHHRECSNTPITTDLQVLTGSVPPS